MTKYEKIAYAKRTVAASAGLSADIFEQDKNVFIESGDEDSFFTLIHFGGNAVIVADRAILSWCIENYADVKGTEIMKGEHYVALNAKLREYGKVVLDDYKDISFMRLENAGGLNLSAPAGFEIEIYEKDRLTELEELYEKELFPQALDEDREEVLAIVALRHGNVVSVASCSEDYKGAFWCIDVDTLAEYRGKGLAAYLVAKIAAEIESRGHVPVYTTWETNAASMHVAAATGFAPVWLWCWVDDIE